LQRLNAMLSTGLPTVEDVYSYVVESVRVSTTGELSRHEIADQRWGTHRILAASASSLGLPRRRSK
jgi:hypothetical protein